MTLREGNREYFYAQLDRIFPGMKQKYIRAFGSSYVCNSPNHHHLMAVFKEVCEENGILWKPDDVFAYLHAFESKDHQLSLF